MKNHSRFIIGLISSVFILFLALNTTLHADAQCKGQVKSKECAGAVKKCEANDGLKAQTTCPVMGGAIDKTLYVDAEGYRFYACCAGCLDKIKADPKKATADLNQVGQKPEKLLTVCGGCGEIKGSVNCCSPEAEKCSKCGLHAGSIGCCRDLKPAVGEKEVLLCGECGEVKGSKACCVADAIQCSGCGLHNGSPGCCKISAPRNEKG